MNKRLVSRPSARERGNTEEIMSAGDCPRDPVRPKTKEKKQSEEKDMAHKKQIGGGGGACIIQV